MCCNEIEKGLCRCIVDAAPVPELIEKYAPGQGLEEVYLAVFGEGDGR